MILGIDEVGRGPWAGPLVIGAVILGDPQADIWQDLNDSKKLTAKKRETLSQTIKQDATATGLGWVSAAELDEIGLSGALRLATFRAVAKLLNLEQPNSLTDFNLSLKLVKTLPFTEIVIDGTINFLKDTSLENFGTVIPKADAKIKEVSAASIIAKVARDNYMTELAKKYPDYGFERHVGYGTAAHRAALATLGPCSEHRVTVKPVAELVTAMGSPRPITELVTAMGSLRRRAARIGSAPATAGGATGAHSVTSSATGAKGEAVVADYLARRGHKILARNHKTKFYEIDIVSATKDHIYFTEVKYRKDKSHGQPVDFIDAKKQQQMAFAATAFMKYLAKKLDRKIDDLPSPILAAAAVEGADFKLTKWFEITR